MTTKQPMKDEETASAQMLQKLMEDDTFYDVELEGSDGVRVPAIRAVLGAKSTTLKTLLFGPFAETKQRVVKIGFPGSILKAVVEYIHTENTEMMDFLHQLDASTTEDLDSSKRSVGDLLSLVEASLYFGLSGLTNKVVDCLNEAVNISPSWSLLILEECQRVGRAASHEVQSYAWKTIRSSTDILSSKVASSLGAEVLESILMDTDLVGQEYQLFQMLQSWCASKGDDRKDIAQNLAIKHIRFENIEPSLLSTSVAASGLVTSQQLLKAYQAQAIDAEVKHGLSFQKPRKNLPVWHQSRTLLAQPSKKLIICDEMQRAQYFWLDMNNVIDGVLRWTVSLENWSPNTWIGVCRPKRGGATSVADFTFSQNHDGVYEFYGSRPSAEEATVQRDDLDDLKFSTGAKITLELDLTENSDDNGTLGASVDGKPMTRIFGDMRKMALQGLKGTEDFGLLPVVYGFSGTRIRLVDITHVGRH